MGQQSPFLVLGVGRCGTSTVARILHTKLNVNMGDSLSPPDEANPLGGYEDLDISKPNKLFVSGHITFPYWNRLICDLLTQKASRGIWWGIKDPTMCHLIGMYLERLPAPKLVRCERPRTLVIPSLMKWYGFTGSEAQLLYDSRRVALDRLLVGRDVLTINFDTKVLDEEIECRLKAKFGL